MLHMFNCILYFCMNSIGERGSLGGLSILFAASCEHFVYLRECDIYFTSMLNFNLLYFNSVPHYTRVTSSPLVILPKSKSATVSSIKNQIYCWFDWDWLRSGNIFTTTFAPNLPSLADRPMSLQISSLYPTPSFLIFTKVCSYFHSLRKSGCFIKFGQLVLKIIQS